MESISVNTISTSLGTDPKIFSIPPIPKIVISPWNSNVAMDKNYLDLE